VTHAASGLRTDARSAAGGIESEAKAMNLGASPMPSLVMVPASATIRSKSKVMAGLGFALAAASRA